MCVCICACVRACLCNTSCRSSLLRQGRLTAPGMWSSAYSPGLRTSMISVKGWQTFLKSAPRSA